MIITPFDKERKSLKSHLDLSSVCFWNVFHGQSILNYGVSQGKRAVFMLPRCSLTDVFQQDVPLLIDQQSCPVGIIVCDGYRPDSVKSLPQQHFDV